MRPVHPTPSENRVRVGARLRASRRAQGLTIEQLASATSLTKGFISRVERDETSPSVATLLTICEVLSLPIGTLFEASETKLVTLADAPLINMGGRGALERMVTPRGESKIQMLRSTLQPEANGGDKLYTVNCDVEVVHLISGAFEIQFTDRTVTLAAGDTITFPGRELHNWKNPRTVDAEVLWTLVPAAWSGAV
ncbi:helix-turn-helix domain-containing protein [Salinibacterium sp. UTAS2018]|uniref:helix-turn-helix domain-containing protein n=1 Tax=Salinibacterium sp. UTAS2018 TaxID=2508880 RepID=UPI0010096C54|nr:helix-turn-helix domain-containing protein [Salinibacterium sp. UTAS2018]QAV70587.1 helix-turn-helix domain-containing protein [Salinibacterium sp. UTAS2018]